MSRGELMRRAFAEWHGAHLEPVDPRFARAEAYSAGYDAGQESSLERINRAEKIRQAFEEANAEIIKESKAQVAYWQEAHQKACDRLEKLSAVAEAAKELRNRWPKTFEGEGGPRSAAHGLRAALDALEGSQ